MIALKGLTWKHAVVLAVTIACLIYVGPTLKPGIWPHKKINLGLDLQGGMHLILEVKTEKAVESTLERIRNEVRTYFREDGIRLNSIEMSGKTSLTVAVGAPADMDKINALLDKYFPDVEIESTSMESDVQKITLTMKTEWVDQIKSQATDQALETIRNRIDQFGVSEPDIRLEGEKRILVQLPGIKDTERAKELIGKTALLEFKLLDDAHDVGAALKGNVPPGTEILYQAKETSKGEAASEKQPYLVKKQSLLTGASLTDARVQIDTQFNEPYVSIDFDKRGARDFERITGENVKKRLAIVLDNKVYSAPVIQEKIAGGKARITGSFTTQEANDLAIVLRAGALPAPVKIIEERTVGPSLGKDSIHKGLLSLAVSSIIILCFMAFYYKLSGVIADIALVLNILMIAAGLAAFGATLTMPGIAGIILTIGMAVDNNILIYERIREERRLGKTPSACVESGFDRASVTIMDANVTTLIAALVLFQFGTGPIKGFAVTLSLGVTASMFTALIMSRLIFDHLYITRRMKTLSV
jgi:preprotein translocase subunit SecD